MPRVTLTESTAERERLKANLKLIQGGRSSSEIAEVIGVSQTTFYNRLKDPESLTLKEVRLLCKRFKIDRARFVADLLSIN